MTEKLLTGTLSLNTTNQIKYGVIKFAFVPKFFARRDFHVIRLSVCQN